MINNLKLLNYKNKLYKVFMEEEVLYINFLGKTKVIHENVLDYCLEYFDRAIWISLYDEKYLIHLFEVTIDNSNSVKINKCLVMNSKKYAQSIDSLTMIIKSTDQINLIFRGWNNNKSFIFNSNISISNNFSIISDNTLNSKIKPFSTYIDENKAMLLISEKNECEEYVLYDLLEDSTEESFLLPNTFNASIIKYENKPVIIYNKEINNNLYLKYRHLKIGRNLDRITNEESIENIPKNIIEPKISVYMGMMYLVWKNNNCIRSAVSRDLNSWTMSYSGKTISSINTKIIKIIGDKVEKISTYMKRAAVYTLIRNEEIFNNLKNDNYKKLELLFHENNLNNKLDVTENIFNIEEYYQKKHLEYDEKIKELNNIINEKDKLIYKLLSIN
ncbi:MAG: hypothetical protein IIV48_04905 [Clostridium sp.]|nr:hypothetical protein [Clostridium sp.]